MRPSFYFRLALAALVAAAVVAGSPLVGWLRGRLLTWWPQAYVPVLAGVVGLCGAALVAGALRHVWRLPRPGRGARVAAIGAAVALAVVAAAVERTGDVNVDTVEAFHFVEFSIVACVAAWAAGPVAPGYTWIWGWSAAVVIGALDEWGQWFVPGRTGEGRDVAIDAVAAACGALLVTALDLGGPSRWRGAGATLAQGLGVAGAAAGLAFGVIHLGHEVRLPGGEVFPSRYDAEALTRLSDDRSRQWSGRPHAAPGLFDREDQYLAEALWHVRRRNRAIDAGDSPSARREQRILETHFAPVLTLRTAQAPEGFALAEPQRAALGTAPSPGWSDASPVPIVAWSPFAYWSALAAGSAGLFCGGRWTALRVGRQSIQPPPTTTSPS